MNNTECILGSFIWVLCKSNHTFWASELDASFTERSCPEQTLMHSFSLRPDFRQVKSSCQGRLNPIRPDHPLPSALPIEVVRPHPECHGANGIKLRPRMGLSMGPRTW